MGVKPCLLAHMVPVRLGLCRSCRGKTGSYGREFAELVVLT